MRPVAVVVAVLVLAGVAVEVGARLRVLDPLTVIPVTEAVWATARLLADPAFWRAALVPTLTAVLASFMLSAVMGIALGIVLGRFERLNAALSPWLTVYYAVPVFAFYPLFVLIFGMGVVPIVVVGTLFGVVAVMVNTAAGIQQMKPVFLKLATCFRLTPWQRFRHVLLPAALPYVFTGLRFGMLYCVIGVIATEFILSNGGLGQWISRTYNEFDLPGMYGGILVVLLLTSVLRAGIDGLARRLHARQEVGLHG